MAAGWGGANPLAQAKTSGEQSRTEQGLSRSLAQSFNQMDPPDHTRIRALVVSAFSRRNIEERRPRIQAVIDGLLDAAAAKGRFDLVTDFAFHMYRSSSPARSSASPPRTASSSARPLSAPPP